MSDGQDLRRHAPATLRNRAVIAERLHALWPAVVDPASGDRPLILEVAAGSGEHAAFLAPQFPAAAWLPTDPDAANRASIEAWRATSETPRPLAPRNLDVTAADWPLDAAEVTCLRLILCANMIHIAPWTASEGLAAGAGRLLPSGAALVLYGPFMRDGNHTAPSNAAFDADLRRQDPSWGVRDLDAVAALMTDAGLRLDRVEPMPANNLFVVFRAP